MIIFLSIIILILIYYIAVKIFKATCNHKWVSAKTGETVCKRCRSNISDFIDILR